MSWLSDIFKTLNPEPPTLAELAKGQCALSLPVQRPEQKKRPPTPDSYIENARTNTFGFNRTTATIQNEGSVNYLTGYDKQILKERGYWSRNKIVIARNVDAKTFWHSGKRRTEAATLIGVSESWIEKRYGSFATALSIESNETEIN